MIESEAGKLNGLTEDEKRAAFLQAINEVSQLYGYMLSPQLQQIDQSVFKNELVVVKTNND